MDKKKINDPRIWLRMAGELAALRALAGKILCEHDYNEVMDKKTWDRLFRVINEVDAIRSRTDTRAAAHIILFGPELFYGCALDKSRKIAMDCREALRAEAEERASKVYGI